MKNNIPCSVIKDLLPSYIDELTSEETNKEVKEHLTECESCNKVYELMKEPQANISEDDEKEIKFLKKNKKRNRRIIFSSIIASVLIIAMVSAILAKRAEVKYNFAKIAVDLKIDDTFYFGSYEQDGNLDNGEEPIEWIVLLNKDNKIYAMSKYGLDNKRYNEKKQEVTWETCSLRKWLNDEFYYTAFSTEEKAMIVDTKLINKDNPYRRKTAKGGNDTVDKVFIADYDEFCLPSFSYELCVPTAYAKKQGVTVYSNRATGSGWWLRTAGYDNTAAAVGNFEAPIDDTSGLSVDTYGVAVRPCITIEY